MLRDHCEDQSGYVKYLAHVPVEICPLPFPLNPPYELQRHHCVATLLLSSVQGQSQPTDGWENEAHYRQLKLRFAVPSQQGHALHVFKGSHTNPCQGFTLFEPTDKARGWTLVEGNPWLGWTGELKSYCVSKNVKGWTGVVTCQPDLRC